MGNHEWCIDCEISDFHHGKPCDPERVKKVLEARAKHEASLQLRLDVLLESLRDAGITEAYDMESGKNWVKIWV